MSVAGWREEWAEIRRRSALMGPHSLLEEIALLEDEARELVLAEISAAEWRALMDSPEFTCRPKQLPPPWRWRWWSLIGGRGFGKNYAGASWVKHRVEREGAMAIGLVGPTMTDVVTNMLEDDDAGVMNIFDARRRPTWISRKDGTILFHTGAVGYCYSAEVPEIRGPNLDTVWINEVVKMYRPHIDTLVDNVSRALRKETSLGYPSCGLVTTTPHPAIKFLQELCVRKGSVVVTGETDENVLGLDPSYIADLDNSTASEAQIARERRGDMVDDAEGALWTSDDIEAMRVPAAPKLAKTIVIIDPAVSTKRTSDETGIIVEGLGAEDQDVYALADASGRHSPEAWGALVVELYERFGCAAILVEDNRIGDNAAANIRAAMRERRGRNAADALCVLEKHAWDGKGLRAEPIATASKRGRVHIVGRLPGLELEMTTWVPGSQAVSPNRIDAMVHGATYLLGLDREKKDSRSAFRGLKAANEQLAVDAASPARVRPFASALAPGGWGGRRL